MDILKEYLYEMTKIQYKTPYIMMSWQYPPRLFERYIIMILNTPFEESNYGTFYGRIKMACSGYMFCYIHCLYYSEELVDKYTHVISLDELIQLTNNTIEIHDSYHQEVVKKFQPINSEREQKQLDEIKSTYNRFKDELMKFCDHIFKIRKQKDVDAFAKEHFGTCLQIIHDMGEFSRDFIARTVCAKLGQIKISLEETLHRIQRNYDDFKKSHNEGINALFNEMYNCNKENLTLLRRKTRSSRETIEMQNQIETIKKKIETFGNKETFERLESEMNYWSRLMQDFDEAANIITKVKTGLDRTKEGKKIHQLYKPKLGVKSCWKTMDKFFDDLIVILEKKYKQACLPIISVFVCPGIDRFRYEDNIGSFYIDEFGHKNYITEFGAKIYHMVCDGKLVLNNEDVKYYFDDCGRYIIEDGEKIYQLAHCTPKYKLNKQGLFEKYSRCTCHHVCTYLQENCEVDLHHLPEAEIPVLPEPVDIKGTLSSDNVNYLWETFGYILPEILIQLNETSKNPMHDIAHLLLTKKYNMPAKEKRAKKNEAKAYRATIVNKRENEVTAKYQEWRMKQMKRCKPEDLDMTDVVAASTSQQQEQGNLYLE